MSFSRKYLNLKCTISRTIGTVSLAAGAWLHWIPSVPPETNPMRMICIILTAEITATQPRVMVSVIPPGPHIPPKNPRMHIPLHGHPIHNSPRPPLRTLSVLKCPEDLHSSMLQMQMVTLSSLTTPSMRCDIVVLATLLEHIVRTMIYLPPACRARQLPFSTCSISRAYSALICLKLLYTYCTSFCMTEAGRYYLLFWFIFFMTCLLLKLY